MSKNRLGIIADADLAEDKGRPLSPRIVKNQEILAKWERQWLLDPGQFDPLRNCMERERVERTWQLLTKHTPLAGLTTVDIGCGSGFLSRRLRDAGAKVEAIDIAENALKKCREMASENISFKQQTMPMTLLPDDGYQVVVCTDVIGDVPPDDYRLFFAELSRLVTKDGYLLCSSGIDIYSEEGVERLKKLAESEFDIIDERRSYHSLYIRCKHILEAPASFIKAWENPEYRKKTLATKRGLHRLWFQLQATPLFVWFWYALEPGLRILRKALKTRPTPLLYLEKICRFLWDEGALSHYIFIAKRRPLMKSRQEEVVAERPKKKQVWD